MRQTAVESMNDLLLQAFNFNGIIRFDHLFRQLTPITPPKSLKQWLFLTMPYK
jgi:hypothetical protein